MNETSIDRQQETNEGPFKPIRKHLLFKLQTIKDRFDADGRPSTRIMSIGNDYDIGLNGKQKSVRIADDSGYEKDYSAVKVRFTGIPPTTTEKEFLQCVQHNFSNQYFAYYQYTAYNWKFVGPLQIEVIAQRSEKDFLMKHSSKVFVGIHSAEDLECIYKKVRKAFGIRVKVETALFQSLFKRSKTKKQGKTRDICPKSTDRTNYHKLFATFQKIEDKGQTK
ncbi:hypothetical protein ACOME3_008997 [Neoechinorhynchus agilis]